MFASFFKDSVPTPAEIGYAAILSASRREAFYSRGGVPDTLDGRFDLLMLHVFLVLNRLEGQGRAADVFGQQLFDYMWNVIDLNLREMGVGDLGVSKRIKAMGQGFYGRAVAYRDGLSDDNTLSRALTNNLFGSTPEPPSATTVAAMANYVKAQAKVLAAQPLEAILSGQITFGEYE